MPDGQEQEGEIRITPDASGLDKGQPQEAKSVATATINRLVAEVPSINRESLLQVEELPLQQQADIIRGVQSAVPDSEKFLLELAVARKMTDPRYDNHADPYFIDPLIHMVEKGHRVMFLHEESQGGVSRHQARFLGKLSESGTAIVVDPDDPDIIALGLGTETQSMGMRMQKPQRQIGDPPVQIEGGVEQTDARGVQGLFELYMGDKKHPAFKTGKDAAAAIERMTTDDYLLRTTVGTVREPARPDTEGVLTLDDGTEIEMANVRFAAIVGVDEEAFLSRGEDEIYLHRPIRVWYNDKWQKGRIAGFGPHGLVQVRCDEKVSDNEDNMEGHGLTVGSKTVDLDLSDPNTPEKRHPLQEYPKVRMNNCMRFLSQDGRTAYGWINQINSSARTMQVETQLGFEDLPFDGLYEIFDDHTEEPEDELLKTGNRFKIHDPQADKDRVFEIKGVDAENDLVIGKIVSLRPSGMSIAHVFPRSQVELLGDPKAILEQYPYLKGRFNNYREVQVKFRHEGEILEGKVLTSKTLPAFVEVIIEKDPPPKGNFVDVYNRYDVKLEDLIGPVEEDNQGTV